MSNRRPTRTLDDSTASRRSPTREVDRLVDRLRPTASIYRSYRRRVDRWLFLSVLLPQSVRVNGRAVRILSSHLYLSRLFQREYLVVSVNRASLRTARLGCDALAIQMVAASLPPLVVVPFRSINNERVRSIVEHEVVHVNQMLRGVFPSTSFKMTRKGAVVHFIQSMRVEYEANRIQLTHWPALYPSDIALSLDDWCALRGYAAALEGMIEALGTFDVSPRFATAVMRDVHAKRDAIFRAAVFANVSVAWFTERWPRHLATALLVVMERHPELTATKAVQAVAMYWKDHCAKRTVTRTVRPPNRSVPHRDRIRADHDV